MKLTIERAALLKALGHVQSAVERRNTIPILSNVLLSAERDRLTFSATDLDMEIIDEALAQVDQPGQITAPAHTLYEIVRKLPEGSDVVLSFTGEDPHEDRAGFVVEQADTMEIFTNPTNQLTEDYVSGRFG